MKTVNLHDAKNQLSKLIQQAQQGEEIIITNHGEPLVKLEPYKKSEEGTSDTWTDKSRISTNFEALSRLNSTYHEEKDS